MTFTHHWPGRAALFAAALLAGGPNWAADPVTQAVQGSGRAGSQASAQSAQAVGGSARATLAVSAIPLAVGGSALATAGQASTAAAGAWLAAGVPLPLTDETITVTPPAQALREGAPAQAPVGR